MQPVNQINIAEGDWVSGTSQRDEKFIGFVQSRNEGGAVKVRVTQSDHDLIVGDVIEAKLGKVRKLAEYAATTPEQLRDLIELALMTHDKEWFEELRAREVAPSIAPDDWTGNPGRGRSRLFRIVP